MSSATNQGDAGILATVPPTEIFRDDLETVGYLMGNVGPRLKIVVKPFSRAKRSKGIVARWFDTARRRLTAG